MRGHQKSHFKPKYPEKYLGDRTKIIARSSWEKMVMHWLDKNPMVIKWASEEVVIRYVSPVDGHEHRYFVDFFVKYRDREGVIREKLLEIKPHGQMHPPKNKHAKNYQAQVETYVVNQAKWEAAKRYAESRKMEFQVLNEYNLGLVKG